jgi:uncharacterized protein YjbI with pentapeptide repeats
VGSRGDATFVKCKVKWFSLAGYKKIALQDCEIEDTRAWTDSKANSGTAYASSTVLVERSKLHGLFDVRAADLQSLTIRDTVIDGMLDLSNATVKGDILIERVRGGAINAYVTEARSMTLRDSQIYGSGGQVFEAYAGGIRAIEIDSVIFGGDSSAEFIVVAGGTGPDLSNVRTRVNDRIVIRKSKVPRLRTRHVHTTLLQLQGCELGQVDLSNSRIDKLELTGNTISNGVDFSNTRAKESRVQALAKGQAKLDGSNIKLPG